MRNIIVFYLIFFGINSISLSQLKINEVMHIPVNKEPEWIELINFQNIFIDSLQLVLSDTKGSFPFLIKDVKPYQYIVVVKDTNLLKKYRFIADTSKLLQAKIPSLNNTGDSLVLRNKNGDLIDFFYFGKDFGRNGISLERIYPDLPADNKENLQPSKSIDSATCGRINSQSFTNKDTNNQINAVIIEPNPFSPNSEKNKTKITINSDNYIIYLSIKIFDVNGNEIKTLYKSDTGDKFSRKEVEWDGTNNLGSLVGVGAYPLLIEYEKIEYENQSRNDKVSIKKIIVVGQ